MEPSEAAAGGEHTTRPAWLRPAGAYEAAWLNGELVLKPGATAHLSIGSVLARSVAIVRDRWATLLLLAYGLGWAPMRVLQLTVHTGYHNGDRDLGRFLSACVVGLSYSAILFGSHALVTQDSLLERPKVSAFDAIRAALAVAPSLIVIWLVCQAPTLLNDWLTWIGVWRWVIDASPMGHKGETMMSIFWTGYLLSLIVYLSGAAAIGMLIPTSLAEQRGVVRSVTRAWRLLRGNRWRFVALYVLYGCVLTAVTVPQNFFRAALRHGGVDLHELAGWITTFVYDGITNIWAVVLAACYLELRRLRDGPPHDQTAEVFA
jgi:hypothetical protein